MGHIDVSLGQDAGAPSGGAIAPDPGSICLSEAGSGKSPEANIVDDGQQEEKLESVLLKQCSRKSGESSCVRRWRMQRTHLVMIPNKDLQDNATPVEDDRLRSNGKLLNRFERHPVFRARQNFEGTHNRP